MKATPELVEEIHFLTSQGLKDAEIAEKVGMCRASVSLYRNSKQHLRNKKAAEFAPMTSRVTFSEEVDYSKLPDSELFSWRKFPSF
jgi:hypothetical protein